MKKILLSLFLFFLGIINISAKTITVKFSDCVDGDTAKFIYNKEEITARFLAIDTPETNHPTKGVEKYGKEASEYTCSKLKGTDKIVLEFDENSDELDKYGRYLVWVFIDDKLLQKELIENGLASVAYLYDDYKYTNILEDAEQIAENKKIGIWSNKEESFNIYTFLKKYHIYIIILLFIVIGCIFSIKFRKKLTKELKKKLKQKDLHL